MRTIPADLAVPRREDKTKHCEVAGCGNFTRERKPYCPEHVDNHPYVQDLLQQLANKADSLKKTKNWKPDPTLISDIVLLVSTKGTITAAAAKREMNIDEESIEKLMRFLAQAGVFKCDYNNRKQYYARLAS